MTDAEDMQPTIPWPAELGALAHLAPTREAEDQGTADDDADIPGSKTTGSLTENQSELLVERQPASRGLIVSPVKASPANLWLSRVEAPPFTFESKPATIILEVARNEALKGEQVQVQVTSGKRAHSMPSLLICRRGTKRQEVALTIPPLARGEHVIDVRVLPRGGETILWDNEKQTTLDVLPNTVGVLHLLGSPSWDGRFLRRYLKAEPKYDLISFFILRDPWDSQQVSERELFSDTFSSRPIIWGRAGKFSGANSSKL